MSLKAHIYSHACYTYLQSLDCLSLPHFHTLQRLYRPIGLESKYFILLKNSTRDFSAQQKNVIVQIDEVHVKSDITYKSVKIIAPTMHTGDPVKTVLATMVSSLHKKWSTIVRLFPLSSTNASELFLTIKSVIGDIENCGLLVQVLCSDNYPQNVNIFKMFSIDQRTLSPIVHHPYDTNRNLVLIFDAVHIIKSIRNNWFNTKDFNHTFIFPSIDDISIELIKHPLIQYKACFEDVRLLYKQEQHSFAKIAHHLTAKSCWPTSFERQSVKLALKVFNESTIAGLKIQNDARNPNFQTQTAEFVSIILDIWKIFNVSTPQKGTRLNDALSKPLVKDDPRLLFLERIVSWIDAWEPFTRTSKASLTRQTFTSLRHTCLALPHLVRHLTNTCGFSYVLTTFLQNDALEHHFGLYRQMSGANYHISYYQIIESERRLKVSSILNLYQSSTKQIQSEISSSNFLIAKIQDVRL